MDYKSTKDPDNSYEVNQKHIDYYYEFDESKK